MNKNPAEWTYEDALALAQQVVQGREDFVYDPEVLGACVYFNRDGTPSCIVGQMLALVGITLEDLDHDNAAGINCLSLCPSDSRALTFLFTLQYEQDKGTPWGKALEVAQEEAEAA